MNNLFTEVKLCAQTEKNDKDGIQGMTLQLLYQVNRDSLDMLFS